MSDSAKFIIRDGAVVADTLVIASTDAENLDENNVALPLTQWLAKVMHSGIQQDSRCDTAHESLPAVWLAPEDDPALLAEYVARIPLIALHFPRFVEGRGFSTAYLLRQRLGFRGELRAFGDIGRDHLWQLSRVGVNSFDLRAGTDLHDAVAALNDYPERYQASADQSLPLFRRRAAGVVHG